MFHNHRSKGYNNVILIFKPIIMSVIEDIKPIVNPGDITDIENSADIRHQDQQQEDKIRDDLDMRRSKSFKSQSYTDTNPNKDGDNAPINPDSFSNDLI